MKKLLLIGASLFGILTAQNVQADCGAGACGDACAPCEQPTGECICRHVRYQPCYYSTTHCYQEEVPCQKTCCRQVPQYYQVQKCRYVPEYYSVTCCRQVPEYYQVPYSYYVTKSYCVPHVRYTPQYFWKRECNPCAQPCAPCGY